MADKDIEVFTEDIIEVVDVDEMSPYDNNYPIELLKRGIKNKIDQAQDIAHSIYKEIVKDSSLIAESHKAMKKGTKYIVDLSDDMVKAIDEGKIKLSQTKDGKLCAQILREDGKFGTKLGIKKETVKGVADPTQITNALQMAALQDQIQCIEKQINSISHSVHDVLQGQQNDRIGLYYSGVTLYIEAQNVDDKDLKNALLVQSLRSLSESTYQLNLTMNSDIKYLVDKGYNDEKGKKVKLIDEKMQSINKSFEFIHQASLMRAAIYCEQGELKAMTTVLSEYSKLIDNSIAKNAGLLALCDASDKDGINGVWNQRAKLRLDVDEIKKQICSNEKIIYIGVEG